MREEDDKWCEKELKGRQKNVEMEEKEWEREEIGKWWVKEEVWEREEVDKGSEKEVKEW